jgi:hypothetical protein
MAIKQEKNNLEVSGKETTQNNYSDPELIEMESYDANPQAWLDSWFALTEEEMKKGIHKMLDEFLSKRN